MSGRRGGGEYEWRNFVKGTTEKKQREKLLLSIKT